MLARDTGFTERPPAGLGLVSFRNIKEAIAGVAEIGGHYMRHRRTAHEMAEEFFSSR